MREAIAVLGFMITVGVLIVLMAHADNLRLENLALTVELAECERR